MKGITLKLFCAILALFIAFPVFQGYAKPNTNNHLELIGLSGISTTPGVFSGSITPSFWFSNFFKQGMDCDSDGNIYLADSGESQIEVFSNDLQSIRNFGSIGYKPDQFMLLIDLKVSQDKVFALDYSLASVKVFNLDGTFQYEFSTQAPNDENNSCPYGLAVSNHQNVFVLDVKNGLKMFDIKGNFVKYIDSISMVKNSPLSYGGIQDLKTDTDGNLYLLFNHGHDGSPMILATDPEGNLLTNYKEGRFFPFSSSYTSNGCFALENNTFYGILWESHSYVFPEDDEEKQTLISGFKYSYSISPWEVFDLVDFFDIQHEKPCPVKIRCPTAFLVKNKQMFILDSSNNTLHKFSDQGELLKSYKSPERPFGILSNISYQDDGYIYFSDMERAKVHCLDKDLNYIKDLGKDADPELFSSPGELTTPKGVCTDWRNYVYVADFKSNCVQVFDEKGTGIATIYPKEVQGKFSDIVVNEKGNLLVSSVSYGLKKTMMILEYDIQNIDKEKYNQVGAITLSLDKNCRNFRFPGNYGSGPFIPAKGGGFILSCLNCIDLDSVDLEAGTYDTLVGRVFDANGKVTRTISDMNQRNSSDSQRKRPQGITYGADHSIFVADGWNGVVWKYDDEYNPLWDEFIQWHGLYSICTDDEGYIYAVDQTHSLVLKFKDNSFIKPSSDKPLAIDLKPYPKMTLQSTVSITGTVTPDSKITLDNKPVFVNREGEFHTTVYPKLGSNNLTLLVRHPSKGELERKIEIFRKEKTLIRMNIGNTQVWIDKDEYKLEAPPFIDPSSNRSYCPIRMVVEAIGGIIQWEESDKSVTIYLPNFELILKVDSPLAYLNGNKISIDPLNEESGEAKVLPKLVNGRVFLPLRFVAEQLQYKVEWLAEKQEIQLHYPNNIALSESWNKVAGLFQNQYLLGSYSSDEQYLDIFVKDEDNTGFLKLDAQGNVKQAKTYSLQGIYTASLKDGNYLLVGTKHRPTMAHNPKIIICTISANGDIITSREILLDEYAISTIGWINAVQNSDGSISIIINLRGQKDVIREESYMYNAYLNLDNKGNIVSMLLYPNMYIGEQFKLRNFTKNGFLTIEVTKSQQLKIYQQDFYGAIRWSYLVENSNNTKLLIKNPYSLRKKILEDGSIILLLSVMEETKMRFVEKFYLFMLDSEGKLQWQKVLNNISITLESIRLVEAKRLSDDQLFVTLSGFKYYADVYYPNRSPLYYNIICGVKGDSMKEVEIDHRLLNCNYHQYKNCSWLVSRINSVPNLMVCYKKATERLFPYSIPSSQVLKIQDGDLLFSEAKIDDMPIETTDIPHEVKNINIESKPGKPLVRSIVFP